MSICLGLLLVLAFATLAQQPVIFDSDMGPDYDDAGAIALLHAFADAGKVKILATMASDKYEGVGGVLSVFNTWFKRPELPVGVPKGRDAVDQKDFQHWTDSLLANYKHSDRRNSELPDAIALYRKLLAAQPDRTVVIVTVGFLTNLSGLLQSGPDEWSSLTGAELVSRKVRRLVSMAGKFPAGREFNVFKDTKASQYVFGHWPGQIILSGFEIGQKIKCGLPLVRNAAIVNDPVKDVFRICIPQAAEDSAGRMSWDETAVLVACAGIAPYYSLRHGTMAVAEDGSNTWKDDAGGRHAHLVEKRPFAEVRDLIDRLMMHQPGRPLPGNVRRLTTR